VPERETILVTGAAGFIGSHLAERLLGAGWRVVGFDNFDPYYDRALKERNLSAAAANERFALVEGDLRDRPTLERLFAEHPISRVVHLAARAGVRPSLRDPELYVDVNVRGTTLLLEQARAARVAGFVFASSSSIYGNSPSVPWREDDPADAPISPYAATKRAGELLCAAYQHVYGLPTTCLRFFTVYGPRQRPEMAIAQFARKIMQGETITLFGDGTTERDYTFVEDIVNGVTTAVTRCPDLGYAVINLGNSQTVPLKRLVEVMEDAIGRKAVIEWQAEQPGDVKRTYADVARAGELLGYQPQTGIVEGVRAYVDWLRRT